MRLLSAGAQKKWEMWSTRYRSMSQRERVLIAASCVGALLYLGGILWIEPLLTKSKSLEQQAASLSANLAGLQSQVQLLGQQVAQDPDQPLRQSLAVLDEQAIGLDQRMAAFNNALVAPEQTAALLDDLVRRHSGVRVAGFSTLPAEGILAGKDALLQEGGAPVTRPARTMDVYQHGFELRLRGNYLDLLAYLKALEAQPKSLLWQQAHLSVLEYPESELVLKVYTLSLDKHWLAL